MARWSWIQTKANDLAWRALERVISESVSYVSCSIIDSALLRAQTARALDETCTIPYDTVHFISAWIFSAEISKGDWSMAMLTISGTNTVYFGRQFINSQLCDALFRS